MTYSEEMVQRALDAQREVDEIVARAAGEQPHVVLVGNPVDGVEVYGPFEDSGEASDWAENRNRVAGWEWWVTVLHDKDV